MQISVGELRDILGGQLRLGSMPPRDGELTPLGRIVTDSRHVSAGDVFWGLRGERTDGAHYAEEAYTRGAIGVVTSGRWVAPWAGRWSLEVADANAALINLAGWQRARFNGSMIAVAGAVGKTTTQAMIDAVLSTRCVGSAPSVMNTDPAQLAIELLRLKSHDDYAVVRVNASTTVQSKRQTLLVEPEVAVFTQFDEHGESAGDTSLDTVREFCDSLADDAVVIANGDDSFLRRTIEPRRGRVIWFGRTLSCEFSATHVESRNGWLRFRVSGHLLQTPVWGRHHLTCALAAVAVGRQFGLEWHEIAAGLAGFRPVQSRCEVTSTLGVTTIDDTCTDRPLATQAATGLLSEMPSGGLRIVVCDDFEGQGAQAPQLRKQYGEEFVCRGGADIIVACGEHADDVVQAARYAGLRAARTFAYRTASQAVTAVRELAGPGDTVLLKGGRESGVAGVARELAAEPIRRAA
jgi:UDP-N-acetylmuramoyl-tripeptide--D-alanyl-D-alanine ligase